MVAKARVIPNRPALRAPPLTAPTAESVLNVLRPRVPARPEMPVTTVAPETMTMAWMIRVHLVAPGHRWSLVVIALGNLRAP